MGLKIQPRRPLPRVCRRSARDGAPCDHPGCLSHVTHPCEGCGRVAGRGHYAGRTGSIYRAVFANRHYLDLETLGGSDTATRIAMEATAGRYGRPAQVIIDPPPAKRTCPQCHRFMAMDDTRHLCYDCRGWNTWTTFTDE